VPRKMHRVKGRAKFCHEGVMIESPYRAHRHRRWGATVKTSRRIEPGLKPAVA
jgi:hypothetical protein